MLLLTGPRTGLRRRTMPTYTTTYYEPFHVARVFATLDLMTDLAPLRQSAMARF